MYFPKRLIMTLSIASTFFFSAAARNFRARPDTTEMTLDRAELLIPREDLKPKKSMVPTGAKPYDTLETSDPRVILVLMDDHTWRYEKNGDLIKNEDYFSTHWDNENSDPYRAELSSLPERITLWLVDTTSQYCCPYQTKVYSKFGYRRGRRHQGVDLPLKTGTPVRATFDGKVRVARYSRGYGNLVIIRHENGLETSYGHLSKIGVEPGQWVHAGDEIGLGGSTGRSTGPHLHFETRYMGYAFDPEWLIDFEAGELRYSAFTLRRKYLSPSSNYVPQSEDEEEEILLAEAEDRAAAEKKAAEEAAKRYHTIKQGDTLGALARKYGTTVRQICAWNGIKETTILSLGRKLRVK